ncbi:hypothetical protein [Formosa maritima]|uniref:GNAT family N-acetyltransferase n=1 Tax=Formosa maritima TaxID=2592046 RepID=A0A5D0GEB3_9FLAO|nr:hypothetical protein [Formosa maritima]TYA56649.1 hypothetical protein FVF61_05795 [Formosa maritima]
MIRNFIKKLQLKQIDVFVFVLDKEMYQPMSLPEYPVKESQVSDTKTHYKLYDGEVVMHRSTLFKRIFLLRLIHKKGPVIGDCYTPLKYRGQSLYPKMIHYIAKNCLFEKKIDELFIIVDTTNKASIRGIEKAGFLKYAQITTKRWLLFYFKPIITYNKNS